FFSSRRRHTRSTRDWSSDVCSSDLAAANRRGKASNISSRWRRQDFYGISTPPINMQTNLLEPGFALCGAALIQPVTMANHFQVEIGRASCRARVERLTVVESVTHYD